MCMFFLYFTICTHSVLTASWNFWLHHPLNTRQPIIWMPSQILWPPKFYRHSSHLLIIIAGLNILFKATILAKFCTFTTEVLLNVVVKCFGALPNLYLKCILSTFLNYTIKNEIHNVDNKIQLFFSKYFSNGRNFTNFTIFWHFCNCGVPPYLQTTALAWGTSCTIVLLLLLVQYLRYCGKSKILNI